MIEPVIEPSVPAAVVPLPVIHKSIVRALCAVQATVEAVTKSGFNKHGNYKFASADDIYAAVTRKLGEVGLIILPLQLQPVEIKRVESDIVDQEGKPTGAKKVAQWGRFEFGFALATEEATWFDPRSSQSLILQITGAQTFNAAESYAQKAYLRALLKIPTGDMDLDAMPQGETEEDQIAATGNGKGKPRKSSAEGKRDGTVKTFNEIKAAIVKAGDADLCSQTWLLYSEELRTMSRGWFDTLCEDFVVTMKGFGVEIDIDEHGWPIIERREAA